MNTRQLLTADQQLGDLVGAVRAATRRRPGWPETVELVMDRLRLHLPSPDVLTAEQRYGDPLTYRCHVLHAESDGSFSIVALVWRPGQATPIHDHVTWCVFGELQGSEREDRFTLRSDGWL
jgi:predicted metal-dependent enzyme (double-stranded beta helix superfamily)